MLSESDLPPIDSPRSLLESDQLLRAVIENWPGGATFVVAPDLRYQFAGGDIMAQLGMSPGDFIGKSLVEALGPELARQYEPSYRHAFNGTPFTVEHQVRGRYFLTHGIPLRDAGNTVFAVMAVSHDITERIREEANAAFLIGITDDFAHLASLKDIMQNVGAKISAYMNATSCFFADVDEEQDQPRVSHGWTHTGSLSLIGNHHQIDESLTPDVKRALHTGETIVVNDTQNDLRTDAVSHASKQIGSFVAVPFHRDGKWRHYLTVYDINARNWQPDEVELLREVSSRIFPHLERARSEANLRMQEERTRIAIEAANLATWEWNLTTNEVFWNEQHFRLFGMEPKPQPLTPDDFTRHVHPDDLARVTADLDRTIRDNVIYDTEFRAVREDGAVRWMSGYGRVTDETNGQATRLSGVMFDIDDRKRVEEVLTNSEERFRTLVQNLPDYAIFQLDPNAIITEWTEGAQRVKGYTADEVIGQSLALFYTPEGLATGEMDAELGEAIEGGRAEREGIRIRKGGERFWVNEIVTAIRNSDGQLMGFTKISRDITDRKRAEAALRQSEEQLRIVMDSITEHALITTDIRGLITGWNPGAQQLFGWMADEVMGQSTAVIFTPEDRRTGESEKEMITAREQGKAADERYHLRKDGSRFYVSGVMSPLNDAAGHLLGYVKVARDLTERQQMEQSLREADRRKDEFLAMLAHELRNPLAPIRNVLQMLQLTGEDDKTIGPAVALMSRQVDHLVRLIDDLLDVSRISRGKIELRRERLDFTALVQQAAEATLPLYESHHRWLQVNLPPFPIYLQGDATRLTQVIANLLTNGVRYTNENGHVFLTLEMADEPTGPPEAILRVRDNGIGLSPDQTERIFELFVQVDNSLARSQGGLGVGLTLVRQLVNMHGGKVEANSAGLGQGSEFIVTLPILQEPSKRMNSNNEKPTTGLNGRKILVVDDNRDAADTLAMLLKLKKHRVHVCYRGREAVEAAVSLQPEVVLLDIGMPELDGYETCRLIRQQPGGNEMVLIALTGYGQEDDKRRSTEAGFNGHFVKPVDLKALTQMLDALPPQSGTD